MTAKRRLLILYDWFYPGFRAGGPIQSLTNLTVALIPDFEIFVITGASDLNAAMPYNGTVINSWNRVRLPESFESIQVFYTQKNALNTQTLRRLFTETLPDILYLNGIFSYSFFLLPLLLIKKSNPEFKVIVCPRGMLKKGALSGKAFKKKIYINYLKLSGLLSRVYWHATTPEESENITAYFPSNKGVYVASNIPKTPYRNITLISKTTGELKLVYLSLINEHKNLWLLLQLVKEINSEIRLDIYGPVTDEAVWSRCEELIKQMPEKVQYKGHVQPVDVQKVLSNYHALILLTKGENFGHALYESLSVGRPVITSYFTPWQNLFETKAGINVDIADAADCINKINKFSNMEQNEYHEFCSGAHTVACTYYDHLDTREKYKQLFGPT